MGVSPFRELSPLAFCGSRTFFSLFTFLGTVSATLRLNHNIEVRSEILGQQDIVCNQRTERQPKESVDMKE